MQWSDDNKQWDDASPQVGETYRSVSLLAVIGFVLGCLSLLCFFAVGLLVIPVVGIVVCCLASWRVHAKPDQLTGRRMALLGLSLSIMSLIAAPLSETVYRNTMREDAIALGDQFLSLLQSDQPHLAMQLFEPPWERDLVPSDELWKIILSSEERRQEFLAFTDGGTVRALPILGDKADIRLYDIAREGTDNGNDYAELWYAVTYDASIGRNDAKPGEEETFFVKLILRTETNEEHGVTAWVLNSHAAPAMPESYKKKLR